MLKKNFPVLMAFSLVLMLFSGCVPAMPANLEENSAVLEPGTTYIGTETIFSSPLFGFIGPTYARYEITEDSVIYKYDVYTEEKIMPVEKWEWQEFPYTEGEWRELFEVPEIYFDIFQYGKIMYQPITELSSFLLVNGEIWCLNITPVNSRSQPFIVRGIELLTPLDSCGSVQWEYSPAMSSKEPYFDFEIRSEFSRIMASGNNLVDVDKPYFQLGNNVAIDDHNFIRWSPADYDGLKSAGAEIDFNIFQNGDNSSYVYSGKLMIETVESYDGKTVYKATLLSPNLMMKTDKNTGKAIIYDQNQEDWLGYDEEFGNDEEIQEKPNFWSRVPFG